MSQSKLNTEVSRAADRITGRRWCFSGGHYAKAETFTRNRRKCDACLDKAAQRRGKPKPTTRSR